MSENKEKAFEATQARKRKARRDGQVCRSIDITTTVVLFAGISYIALSFMTLMRYLVDMTRYGFNVISSESEPQFAHLILSGMPIYGLVGGFVFVVVLAATGSLLGQFGFVFTTKQLKFEFERLSPKNYVQNNFNIAKYASLVSGIIRLIFVGFLLYYFLLRFLRMGDLLTYSHWSGLWTWAATNTLGFVFAVLAVNSLFAGFDYWFQRKNFLDNLRMDASEIKRERRDQDQAPEVKQALAQARHELLAGNAFKLLGHARVVVANPTHIAIPLVEFENAWWVLGKETDEEALILIRIAESMNIPVMRSIDVARSLYYNVDELQQIPADWSDVLREVLDWLEERGSRSPS